MTQEQPNVLLVSVDQWPASAFGCYGHPTVLTPTIDSIARTGVRFTNAYSDCPVCVPARRTLMTGLRPHSHGMLSNGHLPMPEVPTLAQTFSDHGYQTMAVGKMHVFPQRQKLGFDDIIIDEEGRCQEGISQDDYELFLGDHGHPGERFAGGMGNNAYVWRPWHLEEKLHVTNWATQTMCRQIVRRDPLRPGFWYLSYSQPHPPMTPLQAYLDMYRDEEIPEAFIGEWAKGELEDLETAIQWEIQGQLDSGRDFKPRQIKAIRRAYYAACTHLDHQLRLVIGTLKQEGLINNTIICFMADHGEMLGNHRLWAKHWMYEDSAGIPMIVAGTRAQGKSGMVPEQTVDDRLVGLSDVMPTLLDLAGIEIPEHCEGLSMIGSTQHEYLTSLWGGVEGAEGQSTTRMLHDGTLKLIYYPANNCHQLFDLSKDPKELINRATDSDYADDLQRLQQELVRRMTDEEQSHWLNEAGELVGIATAARDSYPNRTLTGQRGTHWPPPPITM